MCRTQESRPWLFSILSYLPLVKIRVRVITLETYKIQWLNFKKKIYRIMTLCSEQELRLLVKIHAQAITPEPYGIQSWNCLDEYISRRYIANKDHVSRLFRFAVICLWSDSCPRMTPEPYEIRIARILHRCVALTRITILAFFPFFSYLPWSNVLKHKEFVHKIIVLRKCALEKKDNSNRVVFFFCYLLLVKICLSTVTRELYGSYSQNITGWFIL